MLFQYKHLEMLHHGLRTGIDSYILEIEKEQFFNKTALQKLKHFFLHPRNLDYANHNTKFLDKVRLYVLGDNKPGK